MSIRIGGTTTVRTRTHARAAELVRALDLAPHPEGGFYRERFRSPSMVAPGDGRPVRAAITTIDFLLAAGQFSRWHALESDEVWHVYEGGPLELVLASPGVMEVRPIPLGRVFPGRRPSCVVPAGWWQMARPVRDYVLCGCTVGPGFEFADFRLLADDPAELGRLRALAPDLARFA